MKSYDELQIFLKPTSNLLREHPETDPKGWMNLIKKEMELGDKFYNNGELDEAYLRYFFTVQMTLEVLPTHKKFSAQDTQYQLLRSRLSTIVTKLEQIKIKLKALSSQVAPTVTAAPASSSSSTTSYQTTNQAFNSAVSSRFPSLASKSGPSTPVKSSSSTPPLSGISAVEIQTLLANSNPKILFIDIRPLEEYIQGHIGWRSPQNIPTAGVINFEPDWLKDGVTALHIDQYLTSFGSSSNSAKLLFDARAHMDLIVFYDNDSRGFKPGSIFELLYQALYSDIVSAPKVLPKVLSGGYISWNYFVANSKDLANSDWVEIGEGNGIRPFELVQHTHSRVASNASSTANSYPNGNVNQGGGYPSSFNSFNSSGMQKSPSGTGLSFNSFNSSGMQKSPSGTGLTLQQYNTPGLNNPQAMNGPSIYQRNSNGNLSINQPNAYSLQQQQQQQQNPVGLGLNNQQPYAPYQTGQAASYQRSTGPPNPIPQRISSLSEDSTGRKSFTRKEVFNDPFLGKGGGLVGAPASTMANASYANYPQSGLSAPLISLPASQYQASHSSISNNSYQKATQSPSKLTSSTFSEPDNPVSYPRAYSRSPSPEMKTSSNEALDFSNRYPTVEVLDQRMTPPPPLIPSKPFTSTSTNSSAQSSPQSMAQKSALYYQQQQQQQLQQQQQQPSFSKIPPPLQPRPQVPPPPPRQYLAASTAGIENRIKTLSVEDMNQLAGPTLPPKPRQVSPPLPPKPAPIETTSKKRVLIRGQHPFVLPSSPVGHKFGISGLRNLGNTCFMNSILQCLSATYPFARYFMDGSYRRHIAKNNPLSSQGRVTEAYASLIRNLWLAEETVVVPSSFKSTIGDILPNFAGTEQQDSQEFLSFLLDQLHEDLNVAKRPFPPNGPELDSENYSQEEFMKIEWQKYRARNWSIIVDMFQGVLQSVLQCLTCGKTSTTYNMFMYLTLPIPSRNKNGAKNGPVTINECLEAFLATEKLSGGDQWKCPRCKVNRDASKSLSIVRLPTVLLIHFKRFSFQGPFRDKLETVIYYPVKRFDLGKYAPQSEGGTYSLCAVSNHFGGLNGGHYTAQVKHVHNDHWFNLDDSRVSESSESEVQSSSAYILFYLSNQNKLSGDWWNSSIP